MQIASRVRRGVRVLAWCGSAMLGASGLSIAHAEQPHAIHARVQTEASQAEAKQILQQELGAGTTIVTHRLASGQEIFLAIPRADGTRVVESLGIDEVAPAKGGQRTLIHYMLIADEQGSRVQATSYAVALDGSLRPMAQDDGGQGNPNALASEPCNLQGPPVCVTSWSGVWWPSGTRICFVLTTTCTDPCGNVTSTDENICRNRQPGDPAPTPRRLIPIDQPPMVA
jgi:hypothetical protein